MRMTQAPLLGGVLVLVAAVAVACGGDEATPEPTPEPTPEAAVEIIGTEFAYEPETVTIPSAGSTTIRLVNGGIVEHDITIDELDFQILAQVGETVDGVLTDVEPGTYRFYCTIPGHEVNGMVGELVVTG